VLTLLHCGYHKCLTVFSARCFTDVLGDRFHDFHGDSDHFHAEHSRYVVSAVTDVKPNLSRLDEWRVSRFIRDPRDLLVSGYFYHRKGVEPWTNEVPTNPPGWRLRLQMAGLVLPGESFAAALQRLDQEDGLIAEMLFRQPTFRNMNRWPNDPRVRVWKYEEILGHEVETMDAVAEHYGWTEGEDMERRQLLRERAEFWRAGDGRLSWDSHVRNPQSGQWRNEFTPKVRAAFVALCGDLPQHLGYEPT
jgi:hypothetical protein